MSKYACMANIADIVVFSSLNKKDSGVFFKYGSTYDNAYVKYFKLKRSSGLEINNA